MREEDKRSVWKFKIKRLLGKKWLYPAIYLTVAAIALLGVWWYQQGGDLAEPPKPEVQQEEESVTTTSPDEEKDDAVPVMTEQELWRMPVSPSVDTEVVTKFFDFDRSLEDQELGLVKYGNEYRQSEGIQLASASGNSFEVTAAMSGTVTEVREDPMLGTVVEVNHSSDVSSLYGSLEEVSVRPGEDVEQGDMIGTAGESEMGEGKGPRVHFEIRDQELALDPEKWFGRPMEDKEDKEESSDEERDDEEQKDSEELRDELEKEEE
ncbi:M23 family metallopeptidase [Salimicrobium halophilum]|nr:M23 family metallopeptidase [Salimicrobium halophilum]